MAVRHRRTQLEDLKQPRETASVLDRVPNGPAQPDCPSRNVFAPVPEMLSTSPRVYGSCRRRLDIRQRDDLNVST